MSEKKIKAYMVQDKHNEDQGAQIVWSSDANGAKNHFTLDYDSWIDLRVKRVPWADGFQNLSESELMVEQLKNDWRFWDIPVENPDNKEDLRHIPYLTSNDVEGIEALGLETFLWEKHKHNNDYYHKGNWDDNYPYDNQEE